MLFLEKVHFDEILNTEILDRINQQEHWNPKIKLSKNICHYDITDHTLLTTPQKNPVFSQ